MSGEEREGINELQWTCTTGSETTSLGIIQYLSLCVTSECVRVVCLCAHVASDLRFCAAASSKRKSVTLLLGYNSALATESIYQETEIRSPPSSSPWSRIHPHTERARSVRPRTTNLRDSPTNARFRIPRWWCSPLLASSASSVVRFILLTQSLR